MTSPEGPDPTPPPDPGPHDPYRPQQPMPPQQVPQPYGYWPPPAPARTSPWVWIAIGATAFITIPAALFALLVAFAGPFAGFDENYSSEDGNSYYVDQGSVVRAVEPACDELQDAAGALTLFGSAADGRAGLGRLAEATRGVAAAIDDADPNDQAALLSADWASVGTAIDDFAGRIATNGAARMEMPQVDGEYVSDRILWGNDVCYVPPIVIALDPDASDVGAYAY